MARGRNAMGLGMPDEVHYAWSSLIIIATGNFFIACEAARTESRTTVYRSASPTSWYLDTPPCTTASVMSAMVSGIKGYNAQG